MTLDFIERSCEPHVNAVPLHESRLMWYGEPEIEPAAFPAPQSDWVATCPPHASTIVSFVAVKTTWICWWPLEYVLR